MIKGMKMSDMVLKNHITKASITVDEAVNTIIQWPDKEDFICVVLSDFICHIQYFL